MCRGGRSKRQTREARGACVEWGGVWGGVSPPQPTRGSENVVSSPSGVRDEAPAANAFSAYSRPQNASRRKKNVIMMQYKLLIQQYFCRCPVLVGATAATAPIATPLLYWPYNVLKISLRPVTEWFLWHKNITYNAVFGTGMLQTNCLEKSEHVLYKYASVAEIKRKTMKMNRRHSTGAIPINTAVKVR